MAAHPDDMLLLAALGAVACDQGQHRRAEVYLRRALTLGTTDGHAAFNLGVALIQGGQQALARAAFEQARTMCACPWTWEAYFDPLAQ